MPVFPIIFSHTLDMGRGLFTSPLPCPLLQSLRGFRRPPQCSCTASRKPDPDKSCPPSQNFWDLTPASFPISISHYSARQYSRFPKPALPFPPLRLLSWFPSQEVTSCVGIILLSFVQMLCHAKYSCILLVHFKTCQALYSSHFDEKKNAPSLGTCLGLLALARTCMSHNAAPQEKMLHHPSYSVLSSRTN